MVDICLEQLSQSCRKLEDIACKQKMEIEQLSQIINRLQYFSPMEHLVVWLKKEKRDIEIQSFNVRNMAEALERIILLYQRTESRIMENAEDEKKIYRYFSCQKTDLFAGFEERIPFLIKE